MSPIDLWGKTHIIEGVAFDLAEHIRRAREDLGWTQSELARRAGIDQADLSRIERGATDPRWSTVNRISQALGAAIVVEQPTTRRRSLSKESREHVRRTAATSKLAPGGTFPVKR